MDEKREAKTMEASWFNLMKWLRSPCCRQPLVAEGENAICSECGTLYRQEGGILILLPPDSETIII